MPIEFNCESCSRMLRVPDGSAGKSCQCPGCGELLEIPTPGILIDEDEAGPSEDRLHIPCPKCKHVLVCESKLLGTKGQCRSCKHIFTISEVPDVSSITSEKTKNWVFNCPKCQQLFEGKESMSGRRGKCHACGEVFDIKLRIADEDSSPVKTSEKTSEKRENPPVSTLVKPTGAFTTKSKTTSPTPKVPKPSTAPNRSASSPSEQHSKAAAHVSDSPIRFNCSGCAGTMEVPGTTAGQMTICPYCKIQLKIPPRSSVSTGYGKQTTAPGTSAAPAAGDIWANLGPPPTPAHQPYNPYSVPTQPSNFAPTGYSAPRRARSSNQTGYTVAGSFIIVSATLELLYLAYQLISIAYAMSRPLPPIENILIYLGVAFAFIILGLILVIIKLFGGIALVRRSGLAMAKTGAILSCLPCLCCLVNLPIGIWACILTFSNDAERHFS